MPRSEPWIKAMALKTRCDECGKHLAQDDGVGWLYSSLCFCSPECREDYHAAAVAGGIEFRKLIEIERGRKHG